MAKTGPKPKQCGRCGHRIRTNIWEEHKLTCPKPSSWRKNRTRCRRCRTTFPTDIIEAHRLTCPKKKTGPKPGQSPSKKLCSRCGIWILRDIYATHRLTCPKRCGKCTKQLSKVGEKCACGYQHCRMCRRYKPPDDSHHCDRRFCSGCDKPIPVESFLQHQQDCKTRLRRCHRCLLRMPSEELARHKVKCSHKKCYKCQQRISVEEGKTHLCKYRLCYGCGQRLSIEEYPHHLPCGFKDEKDARGICTSKWFCKRPVSQNSLSCKYHKGNFA